MTAAAGRRPHREVRAVLPLRGSRIATAALSMALLAGLALTVPIARDDALVRARAAFDRPSAACVPAPRLVDPRATRSARCLAATLDRWRDGGSMAIGQQLMVANPRFAEPLNALSPGRPAVVGFDLNEVRLAKTRGFDPTDALIALAREGAVLTASWHARNPMTGGPYDDLSQTGLEKVLAKGTPAATAFWRDWDASLRDLRRFQEAGIAVIVRPLHEATGTWFWWSRPRPSVHARVWNELQRRAAARGVHNLLWAYSAALEPRSGARAALRLLPASVDLVGLDTYQSAAGNPAPRVDLTGYAALSRVAPRMALTEVGPHGSDGSWNPRVITDTLRRIGRSAVYALLWFDDGDPADGIAGIKSVASLAGGPQWLASCPSGVCLLRSGASSLGVHAAGPSAPRSAAARASSENLS